MVQVRRNTPKVRRKWTRILLVMASSVALSVLVSQAVADTGKGHWFQTTLERGEARGYEWAAGVKVPTHRPLSRVCVLLAMAEQPKGGASYVEGVSSTECGRLSRSSDSVFATESFGPGRTRVTVLEVIYHPAVRRVVLTLNTGERMVFRPQTPRIPNRAKRGIPSFRYLVTSFDGGACIRRAMTFDGSGKVLARQEEPCSSRPGGS